MIRFHKVVLPGKPIIAAPEHLIIKHDYCRSWARGDRFAR